MDVLSLIFIFILGTLIGSFINVVALRYNSGMSWRKGRSMCFSCGRSLTWFELVPLVSFLFLHGRCRTCNAALSWQYPLVEILTGLMFLSVFVYQVNLWPLYSVVQHGLLYSVISFFYYVLVFSLLFIIVLYDIRHMIIPDTFVYTFIVASLVKLVLFLVFKNFALTTVDFFDLCAPLIVSIPFALLWLVSGGKWIGFGDAKLAFGIGALLGFVLGVSAVVLAFWIGSLWAIGLLVQSRFFKSGRKVAMKSEVPFAPFLILATFIIFITRIDLFNLRTFLDLLH